MGGGGVVLCCVVLCCVALRCVVLHCVVLCCVALCCVVLCCIVLHCVVLCCVALCCIVLCCVVLHCVVLCCVVVCCVALCWVVLHCVVLCCVVLGADIILVVVRWWMPSLRWSSDSSTSSRSSQTRGIRWRWINCGAHSAVILCRSAIRPSSFRSRVASAPSTTPTGDSVHKFSPKWTLSFRFFFFYYYFLFLCKTFYFLEIVLASTVVCPLFFFLPKMTSFVTLTPTSRMAAVSTWYRTALPPASPATFHILGHGSLHCQLVWGVD